MLRYKNYFGHIFMEEIKASNTIKIRKSMQKNASNYHTSVGSKCSKNISNYTYYYEHYIKIGKIYHIIITWCASVKRTKVLRFTYFCSKGK